MPARPPETSDLGARSSSGLLRQGALEILGGGLTAVVGFHAGPDLTTRPRVWRRAQPDWPEAAPVASRRPRARRLTLIRRICFAQIDLFLNAARRASCALTANLRLKRPPSSAGDYKFGARAARKRCAEQALRIFALLAAGFRDSADPTVRTRVVKAQIRKAVTLVQLAHLREAKASFGELFALGDEWNEVLSAISDDAERRDGAYTSTELATAFLASGADIDQPRRRIEILEAANKILERRQGNKAPGVRFVAWSNRKNIEQARRRAQPKH
jgi:hypothetical protein